MTENEFINRLNEIRQEEITSIEKKVKILLNVDLSTFGKSTVIKYFKECFEYLLEEEKYEVCALLKKSEDDFHEIIRRKEQNALDSTNKHNVFCIHHNSFM